MRVYLFALILTFCFGLNNKLGAQSLTKSYVPGEVIVKYKNQDGPPGGKFSAKSISAVSQKSRRIMSEKGLSRKNSWDSLGVQHYKIEGDKNVKDMIAELKNDPDIEFAEPNYYVQASTAVKETGILNDQELQSYLEENYYPAQVGAQGLPYDQTGAQIEIPETWAVLSPAGTKPVVAIIDTGIDITHRSLVDAIWTNPGETAGNGLDDDGNGYVDDIHGWNFVNNNNNVSDCNDHGTHVAGIVRGATQDAIPNGAGIYSGDITQSKLELMAVKFLDCDGIGTTAAAINGIYYAVNNGAKILNNSWGGGGYSSSLHQAIVYTYNNDTLFVAAAGNSGVNIDSSPSYPASYPVPNVVAVAATNTLDYLPYFSNYGISSVHIAAPGVGIMSSIPGGGHISMSGTSMAAPFIAGIAAMMAYEQPTMIGYQMKTLLTDSIDQPFVDSNVNGIMDVGETYKLSNKVKNNGRVNSYETVQSAQVVVVNPTAPSYSAASYDSGRSPSSEAGGGCGLVQKVYEDYDNEQTESPLSSSPFSVVVTFLVFLVPVLAALTMRQNTKFQRRYDRFHLGSQVQIQMGQREYLGSVGTISLGGLSFNSDAILKLGHTLDLAIASPNGQENLNVQGQVVWMSNNNSYGVKFQNIAEETIGKITSWTQGLKKA